MVGKWHQGFYNSSYTPLSRGFDSFLGYYLGAEDYWDHSSNEWLDGSTYEQSSLENYGKDFYDGDINVGVDVDEMYSTYLFNDRAIDIIEQHSNEIDQQNRRRRSSWLSMLDEQEEEEEDQDNPLFMYLSFQATHCPLDDPKNGYTDMYVENGWSDDQRVKFGALTTAMDDVVGNVTDKLKEEGMWENTIVVFSADNGGNTDCSAFNFPYRGAKETVWEGGTRVNGFIASGIPSFHDQVASIKDSNPDQFDDENGVFKTNLMHMVDWYATLIEMIGFYSDEDLEYLIPSDLDSIFGMFDVILSEDLDQPSPRNEMVYNIDSSYLHPEMPETGPDKGDPPCYGIRRDNIKLVVNGSCSLTFHPNNLPPPINEDFWILPPEASENDQVSWIASDSTNFGEILLFNLSSDPYETIDIGRSNPDLLKEMLDWLEELKLEEVPAKYYSTPPDDNANPAYYGDLWVSWGDYEDVEGDVKVNPISPPFSQQEDIVSID